MLHRRWQFLPVFAVLVLALLLFGCPKRPATTSAVAPAPGAPTPAPPGAKPGEPVTPSVAAPTTPREPSAPGMPSAARGPGAPGAPTEPTGPTEPTAPGAARAPGAPSAAVQPTPQAAAPAPAPKEFVDILALEDIHFNFDKYDIRPGDAQTLDENAKWMRDNPNYEILVEGHCDERGTNEYNLALGERRAKATVNYLISQGIQAGRFTLISYGEERPQCTAKHEACWSTNRRAHFLVRQR